MIDPNRREFLKMSSTVAGLAGVSGNLAGAAQEPEKAVEHQGAVEWRNKQAGMAYRRLGRTGLMVSEVVCGGDPITLENYKHLELALEMGLNYLDMAPAYNGGDTERAYGKLIAGRRDKVFLTTKASGFSQLREKAYREIFDDLPADRQEHYRRRANEIIAERGVSAPGYHITYYPGQHEAYFPAYLRVAMMGDYAEKVEGDPAFARHIVESLEGSLKRLGTDHVDILMCPHGASSPEELDSPESIEVFNRLKQQGKVRFLGVTSHNDPAGVLRKATALGHYDLVMMAYNVVNGGYVDGAIREAAARDVGVIAMKVAHAVATHHESLQPIPDWRIEKVEKIVPGGMKAPMKAYVWALQNPRIAAVIANLWDEEQVRENLGLAGKKVELEPA